MYKEVLVQPSCVCKPQICSNFTFSSMLQHHTSAPVRFPPGNKYSHKNTWSQLVTVVLKHVKFSLSLLSLCEQMRCAEMKKSKIVYGSQICSLVTAGLVSYIKSTQIVTKETYVYRSKSYFKCQECFVLCLYTFFSSVAHTDYSWHQVS